MAFDSLPPELLALVLTFLPPGRSDFRLDRRGRSDFRLVCRGRSDFRLVCRGLDEAYRLSPLIPVRFHAFGLPDLARFAAPPPGGLDSPEGGSAPLEEPPSIFGIFGEAEAGPDGGASESSEKQKRGGGPWARWEPCKVRLHLLGGVEEHWARGRSGGLGLGPRGLDSLKMDLPEAPVGPPGGLRALVLCEPSFANVAALTPLWARRSGAASPPWELDLSLTSVVDVSALGGIRKLNLSGTNVVDVSALGGALELDLSNTAVEDVSALGRVRTLVLYDTKVADVSALGGVHRLNLSGTRVVDASALGRVHTLDLSHTEVVDVAALCDVHTLDLSHTEVVDVAALGGVHTLNLSSTAVVDVSALGGVRELDLSHTDVVDVSALGGVHKLDLSHTNVVDATALGGAYRLDLSYTRVTDVSALGGVRTLLLRNTRVADASALGRVDRLDLTHTLVADASALGGVRELDLSYTIAGGTPAQPPFGGLGPASPKIRTRSGEAPDTARPADAWPRGRPARCPPPPRGEHVL